MSKVTSKDQVDLTIYLKRSLKGIHPDYRFSSPALRELNSIVNVVGKHVVAKAEELTRQKGQMTLYDRAIYGARDMIFGDDGLTESGLRPSDETEKGVVNITVPPARAAYFIKSGAAKQVHLGKTSLRVGKKTDSREGAAEALASVLNAFLFTLLANLKARKGKLTITARDLFLASHQTESIREYFDSHGITIAGGGVVPSGVHPALERKTTSGGNKKYSKRKGDTTKHKFRPGTVSMREITKYQKSGDLLLQKAPIQRFVRDLAGEGKRISGASFAALQHYIESDMTSVLEMAGLISINAKRQTVTSADIDLAKRSCGHYAKQPEASEPTIEVSVPGIHRLARRGGVKRITADACQTIRSCIEYKLVKIMKAALVYTDFSKRKTVNSSDVIKGIETAFGQKVAM